MAPYAARLLAGKLGGLDERRKFSWNTTRGIPQNMQRIFIILIGRILQGMG